MFDPERSFFFRYMKVFYHSSLTYSMVDISTRTMGELMFMIVLILISAIINAIVFGQFSLLTEELKRDSNEFLNKLNLVNSVMASENLPREIRESVRDHILKTHSLRRLQEELIEFNGAISPSLREIVRVEIFSRNIKESILSRYMKTSLYKEWLEIKTLNASLEAAGQPTVTIEPVDKRFSYIL